MNKTVKDSRFTAGHRIAGMFLSAVLLATSFTGLGGIAATPSIEADAAAAMTITHPLWLNTASISA